MSDNYVSGRVISRESLKDDIIVKLLADNAFDSEDSALESSDDEGLDRPEDVLFETRGNRLIDDNDGDDDFITHSTPVINDVSLPIAIHDSETVPPSPNSDVFPFPCVSHPSPSPSLSSLSAIFPSLDTFSRPSSPSTSKLTAKVLSASPSTSPSTSKLSLEVLSASPTISPTNAVKLTGTIVEKATPKQKNLPVPNFETETLKCRNLPRNKRSAKLLFSKPPKDSDPVPLLLVESPSSSNGSVLGESIETEVSTETSLSRTRNLRKKSAVTEDEQPSTSTVVCTKPGNRKATTQVSPVSAPKRSILTAVTQETESLISDTPRLPNVELPFVPSQATSSKGILSLFTGNKPVVWKQSNVQRSIPYSPWKSSLPAPDEILEPIEYFRSFLTDELIEMIVDQTNLYSEQKQAKAAAERKKKKEAMAKNIDISGDNMSNSQDNATSNAQQGNNSAENNASVDNAQSESASGAKAPRGNSSEASIDATNGANFAKNTASIIATGDKKQSNSASKKNSLPKSASGANAPRVNSSEASIYAANGANFAKNTASIIATCDKKQSNSASKKNSLPKSASGAKAPRGNPPSQASSEAANDAMMQDDAKDSNDINKTTAPADCATDKNVPGGSNAIIMSGENASKNDTSDKNVPVVNAHLVKRLLPLKPLGEAPDVEKPAEKVEKEDVSLDATKNDIEQFIGICFYMSITGMPKTRMYWSKENKVPQVVDAMGLNKWEKIKNSLHFNDNEKQKDSSDNLYKLQPFIDGLNHQYNSIPMDELLSVDEQIIPFKGKSSLKQYDPKKPRK